MAVRPEVLIIILGTGLVTLLPRIVPMVLVRRLELPEVVSRWLGFVPIAVIASLLAQELLMPEGNVALPRENLQIVAGIPALITVVMTRSLIGCVVAGILTMTLLRLLL